VLVHLYSSLFMLTFLHLSHLLSLSDLAYHLWSERSASGRSLRRDLPRGACLPPLGPSTGLDGVRVRIDLAIDFIGDGSGAFLGVVVSHRRTRYRGLP
jgi:hypothetical protein